MAKAKKSPMSSGSMKKMNYGGMSKMQSGGSKKFPDLTGDGKVTRADILKGRGVIKYGGTARKAQMGGMTPSNVSKSPNITNTRTRGAGPANIINALRGSDEYQKQKTIRATKAEEEKTKRTIERQRGKTERKALNKMPFVMDEPLEPMNTPTQKAPMYTKSPMYKKGGSVKSKKKK